MNRGATSLVSKTFTRRPKHPFYPLRRVRGARTSSVLAVWPHQCRSNPVGLFFGPFPNLFGPSWTLWKTLASHLNSSTSANNANHPNRSNDPNKPNSPNNPNNPNRMTQKVWHGSEACWYNGPHSPNNPKNSNNLVNPKPAKPPNSAILYPFKP